MFSEKEISGFGSLVVFVGLMEKVCGYLKDSG